MWPQVPTLTFSANKEAERHGEPWRPAFPFTFSFPQSRPLEQLLTKAESFYPDLRFVFEAPARETTGAGGQEEEVGTNKACTQQVYGHRVMFHARVPAWAAAVLPPFTADKSDEAGEASQPKEPMAAVHMTDVSLPVFKAFMEYVYTNDLQVRAHEKELKDYAHKHQVPLVLPGDMQQGSTRRVTFDPFPFVESMLDCLEKTCQDKSEEEGKPASSSSLDNSLKALSDVTFVVQGQPLRAHKPILTAVSPYFERMFSAGLLEAQSNRVVVDDASPAIFKQLLAFIYSGANPDIIDEKKQEATNAQAVLELLPLAHRYNLSALVYRCQYCLCKEVDESNACLLYDIAEYHDCPLLSEFCMAYLRTHFVTMAERGFLEYASEELLKKLATNVQKDVKYQHMPFPPTEVPLNHSTFYRTLIELLSDGLTEYAATLARAKKRQESARIEAEKEKETEEEEESEQEEKGRERLTSSASSAAEEPHNALKLWRDLSTITLVSLVDLSASDSRVVHSLRCQNLLNKFFPSRGIVCNPSAAEVTELPSPETLQDGHIYMMKTQRYAAPTLCSEIATAMKLPLPAILKEVFMFKFHDNGAKRGKRGAYDLILLLTLGSRKVDEKALKRYFKSLEGERPFIKRSRPLFTKEQVPGRKVPREVPSGRRRTMLALADRATIYRHTGYSLYSGSLPAFYHRKHLRTIVDPEVLMQNVLYASSGDGSYELMMTPATLKSLLPERIEVVSFGRELSLAQMPLSAAPDSRKLPTLTATAAYAGNNQGCGTM